MMAPTLVTSPASAMTDAARTTLEEPLPEAVALRPVLACAGRQWAAGLSPEGALAPWGGPAALKVGSP